MKNQLGWKVPFRQVYCATLEDCVKQTFWCHVVIKVFPNVIDINSDALVQHYPESPRMFYEQYSWRIKQAIAHQKGEAPPPHPMNASTH